MNLVSTMQKIVRFLATCITVLTAGCAVQDIRTKYDPVTYLAKGLVKGYRSITGTASPEELLASASRTLQELPRTSWADAGDKVNMAALHRLIQARDVKVGFEFKSRNSVVPKGALTRSPNGIGFFRNKTIAYASVDWSYDKPSVFLYMLYISDDDEAFSPRGMYFDVSHTENGYCLGKSKIDYCFSSYTDEAGRAYLLESGTSSIGNQVVFIGNGDLFNIVATYKENNIIYRRHLDLVDDENERRQDCADSVEGDFLSRSIRVARDCGGLPVIYYPDAISGKNVIDKNKWLNIEEKRIGYLGSDVSWDKDSGSYFGYYVTHLNEYSRTFIPPLDRRRNLSGDYLEWTGEPVKQALVGGLVSIPTLRSMLDEKRSQQLTRQEGATLFQEGRTIIAVAPDYPPFGGRDLRFAGYTIYIDKFGDIYSIEGRIGKLVSDRGMARIVRNDNVEEISFSSGSEDGSSYLVVQTGPNIGLVLRVVLSTKGDVFGLSAVQQSKPVSN